MTRSTARVAGLLLSFAATTPQLRAQATQSPPPAPGFAALVGLVVDSLHGGRLARATVVIVGTNRRGTTDTDGMFRIDSIVAGDYQVAVLHPLLDTLGLVVASDKLTLPAGKTTELGVMTPTLSILREHLCPKSTAQTGIAMLAGRVEDADTGAPLANAAVSIVYVAPISGSTMQRVRTARTRDDGLYVICGLPSTIIGTVQVTRGGLTSGEVPVTLKEDLLGTASMTLGAAAAADTSVARRKASILSGRITDPAGTPIKEAQVAVEGGNVVAITDADGRYTLRGLAPGTSEAVVRKLGFAPVTKIVHLTNREGRTLNVALSISDAQVLAPVKVVGKLDEGLKKVGYSDRVRFNASGATFLGPTDVDRRQARQFTDIFRTIAGFTVRPVGSDQMITATRNQGTLAGCVNVFLDRVPMEQAQPGDLDQMVPAYQIGAIEAYPSANATPPEFQMPGKSCATIVVWTKFKLGKP